MRRYLSAFLVALLVLALDQASKSIVLHYIPPNASRTVIPGFFDLVNYRNRGAAFGFLNRSDIEWQFWLFLISTLIAAATIIYLLKEARKPSMIAGLGLILGGALGNLADRLRFRSVTDFLDFYYDQWHWPAFNVADMGICIGAFLTCIALWNKESLK